MPRRYLYGAPSRTVSPDPDADGPRPDTDGPRPDSTPDEEVYVEPEEGAPRQAGRSPDNEGVYAGYPEAATRLTDPKVYGGLLLVGVALVLFPEPATSALGVLVVGIALFVGAVDVQG